MKDKFTITFYHNSTRLFIFYFSAINRFLPPILENMKPITLHADEAKGSILLCIDPFASFVCISKLKNI